MDALLISEISDLDYVSDNSGETHVFGHDGHTSIHLGTAKYLTKTGNFSGKVVLIFQPAEEGGGGELATVVDGVMERWNVDGIYGLRNMSNFLVVKFAIRTGPLLAVSDVFEIEVMGKGGHGAMPHQTNNTTLATAAIMRALQQIVRRQVPALKSVVVSVTGIQKETMARNIILGSERSTGTIRFLDKVI